MLSFRRAILLSIFFVVTALPAIAKPPEVIGPLHDEGASTIGSCGTFDVVDHFDLNYTLRFMVDQAGTQIRLVEEVWGVDTLTNSVTGKSLPGPYHNNTFVDFRTGTVMLTGLIFRVNLPGVGALFFDVGRVVIAADGEIVASAGRHDFFDGDFDALCAALSD